jgi:hypothetical protein
MIPFVVTTESSGEKDRLYLSSKNNSNHANKGPIFSTRSSIEIREQEIEYIVNCVEIIHIFNIQVNR